MKKLSPAQKKIAAKAKPKNKITGADKISCGLRAIGKPGGAKKGVGDMTGE